MEDLIIDIFAYFPVDAGPFALENGRPEIEPAETEERGRLSN